MAEIAVIQMRSGRQVEENLEVAANLIQQAGDQGAAMAILPENFAQMAKESQRRDISERAGDGRLQEFLSAQASRSGIWIVGGTIPLYSDDDRDDQPPVASCLVIDASGERVARYDKIHLFDVGIPGGEESYRESNHTFPGGQAVCVDTPVGRLGLAVCYDIRFPELFLRLTELGMEVLVLPAAFTSRTGKAHWEVLLRARAIESLCYVAAAAQGGQHENGRETWGHSMLIDPWGEIIAELKTEPGVLVADTDLLALEKIRQRFPALEHRRIDRNEGT